MASAVDDGDDAPADKMSTVCVDAPSDFLSLPDGDPNAGSVDMFSDVGVASGAAEEEVSTGASRDLVVYSHSYLLDRETELAMMEKYVRHHIVERIIVSAAADEAERMRDLHPSARRELEEMRRLGLVTHFESTSAEPSLMSCGHSKKKALPAVRASLTGKASGTGAQSSARTPPQHGTKDVAVSGGGAPDASLCPAIACGTVCEACFSGDGLWYPAEILKVLPRQRVRVRFFCYHNEESVPRSWIRQLGRDGRNSLSDYLSLAAQSLVEPPSVRCGESASKSFASSSMPATLKDGNLHLKEKTAAEADLDVDQCFLDPHSHLVSALHRLVYSPYLLLSNSNSETGDTENGNCDSTALAVLDRLTDASCPGHALRCRLLRSFRTIDGQTLAEALGLYDMPLAAARALEIEASPHSGNSTLLKGSKSKHNGADCTSTSDSTNDAEPKHQRAAPGEGQRTKRRVPRRQGFLHRHSAIDVSKPNPTPDTVLDKYWVQRYGFGAFLRVAGVEVWYFPSFFFCSHVAVCGLQISLFLPV